MKKEQPPAADERYAHHRCANMDVCECVCERVSVYMPERAAPRCRRTLCTPSLRKYGNACEFVCVYVCVAGCECEYELVCEYAWKSSPLLQTNAMHTMAAQIWMCVCVFVCVCVWLTLCRSLLRKYVHTYVCVYKHITILESHRHTITTNVPICFYFFYLWAYFCTYKTKHTQRTPYVHIYTHTHNHDDKRANIHDMCVFLYIPNKTHTYNTIRTHTRTQSRQTYRYLRNVRIPVHTHTHT